MAKIEIPADEMKRYADTNTAIERAVEEATGNLKVFMNGGIDSFDKVRIPAEAVRRLKLELVEIVNQWGRSFMFDPKRVYLIDWRKNEVGVSLK